ncbi:MAG TPA: hypothetical protein VNJ08_05730 [Bacteriovoracaceae bacterium]|nr:hypothetical protein [Bacteriovoracaceae bacterium]
MKILLIILSLALAFPAFALKVKGKLGIDGETWKYEQKVDHNKEVVFPLGTFILKMTLKPLKKDESALFYVVQEKKGSVITEVTKGDDEIKTGVLREIYAKGHEGQPGSIITIRITK